MMPESIYNPVQYVPTNSISSDELTKIILKLIDIFASEKIQICWSSSDGFSTIWGHLKSIREKYSEWMHIFDYAHLYVLQLMY